MCEEVRMCASLAVFMGACSYILKYIIRIYCIILLYTVHILYNIIIYSTYTV